MRTPIAALAATTLAVGAVALAPSASAYDRDAYSYAAAHMIERSDIPSALGAYDKNPAFNGYEPSGATVVCDVPNSDPSAPSTLVRIPSGRFQWTVDYAGKGKGVDSASLGVVVSQYATSVDAIKAFNVAKKRVKQCDGQGSDSWTDPDSGVTNTYSQLVTNGVVPAVTVVGVESLFVSKDALSETQPGDDKVVNDQYSVLTLVDDVILITSYYANTNNNLTTKQRKAVNQVAFNAVTRWLE